MSRRIWMKKTIEAVKAEDVKTPWARGSKRKAIKAAARTRAQAA